MGGTENLEEQEINNIQPQEEQKGLKQHHTISSSNGPTQPKIYPDQGRNRKLRRLDNNSVSSFKPHTRVMSRENSFVRQSSMIRQASLRSEIFQSIKVNNIVDIFEKLGPVNNSFITSLPPNESFGLLNRVGSRHSSFISN